MIEEIEILARQKPFSQLTDAEQALVLDIMSGESYQQLRRLLLLVPTLDAQVQPSAQLRASLLQQFDRQMRRRSWLERSVQARLPVWQAAAALLLAVGLVGFWNKKAPVQPQIITQTTVRIDTFIQDRVLWKDRVVWRYRPVPPPVVALVPTIESEAHAPTGHFNDWAAYTDLDTIAGSSLAQQPELLQFFTQPNKSDQ